MNQTIHKVNLLLFATKQTQMNVNQNSAHLFRLQRYLSSISRTISISFLQAKRAIEHIELKFKLEHVLISLEQSTHRIAAYYNRRQRQMNNIYHRSLSEDILPLTHLQSVLKQAGTLGFRSMPTQWYYRNCKISPVWSTLESITFRVHLPLHDGKNYLLHSFKSIPFPVKPGFKATLQVKNRVAYSSTSGSLFQPRLCTGVTEKICRGGPLYRTSSFSCERALLSGDRTAHSKCSTKVTPSNTTVITEDTPGFYTMSTFEISAKLHCDALRERNINLDAGVYLIALNHSCTLRNLQWTLPGLNKFKTPLHIKTRTIPIHLDQAFAPLTPLQMDKLAQSPSWTPIHKLQVIAADPVAPLRPWFSLQGVDPITWTNSISIGLIVCSIIVAVMLIKVCRKYPRLRSRWFSRNRSSASPGIELETVVPPPRETAPERSLRLPQYPDLSRDRSTPSGP